MLLYKRKHKNTKETYTYEFKNIGKKVGFAAIFMDIIKRGTLPTEPPFTQSKWQQKNSIERDSQKMGNIYRFSELYAIQQIQKIKYLILNQI